MEISSRLKCIASFVEEKGILADVGTDHGYVPIELLQNGKIRGAIAMDINPGPLQRAEANIRQAGLEDRIVLRLSDGMENLKPKEADSILIAGMGGQLMTDILKRGLSCIQAAKEIVLSPHSCHELVRRFLWEENFFIQKEDMIVDEDKYYVIIRATWTGRKIHVSFSEVEALYGPRLLQENNPILKEYLVKERKKMEKLLKKVPSDKNEKIKTSLEQIRKGLMYYEND